MGDNFFPETHIAQHHDRVVPLVQEESESDDGIDYISTPFNYTRNHVSYK